MLGERPHLIERRVARRALVPSLPPVDVVQVLGHDRLARKLEPALGALVPPLLAVVAVDVLPQVALRRQRPVAQMARESPAGSPRLGAAA
ncbi:zinc finger protein [Gracilaria domingensis]|nr:zinc finger protein [Gracilaria domingensis]